jgi:PAS domain S-box-containing protein
MPIVHSKTVRRLISNIPLRWALTVSCVLPTIGAVTLVGYLSYRSGQTAVEDLGLQLVAETNERVIQELKIYLQTPLLINRLNIDAVNQGQLDLEDVQSLEATLFNRLQQFEQVSAVLFANPEGRFRLVDRLPDLYMVVAEPPHLDRLLIYQLDRNGKRGNLVHTNEGLDVRRDRPWYQRAAATGQPGWNSISQYGSLNLLSLDASQPVYDPTTKRLLGVFAVHTRLDYLSEFLHRLDIGRVGQIIIIDQDGALIATSTREQPYKFGAGTGYHRQFQRLNIAESQDELTRSLGEYLRDHPELWKSLDQPRNLNFRHDGELQFIEITPFQDPYGLNWRIVTAIPQSHFLAAIESGTRQTFLLCVVTLGAAILLGLLAANLLTARFIQLNQASRELAAGNLDQHLPTDSPIHELNRLAQTFNQMADQLQQSFTRIRTALEESEEKFTTIFRTSPDPMAIASLAEGRLLEVNDSLIEFFGYSRAEMIGRTTVELNFWHNLAQRRHCRTLLQQQGSARNLEVQLRTKSGEVRTVLLSAGVQTLEGQDCVIVMHRDISERKAIELALQQSQTRYRAIVEDQTDLISRFLPDTTVVFVNDAYCRYFNINPADIIGKSYSPIIYEADRAMVAHLLESMSVANPTVTIENRVVVNGEIRWTQWVNRMLFDQQGKLTEFQSVGRDITDLKQTEDALRQSEERFREIAQTINQVFFVLSATTGQYLYISPAYEKIWGRTCESLYQDPDSWLEAIHPHDRQLVLQSLQTQANDVPVQREYRIIQPDGTVRWILAEVFPIQDDTGQLSRYVGLAEDMTERKQLEQSLRAQAEEERLLTTITQNIRQSLDLEQILATTVREVQQTLNADRALIFRLHPDGSGQIIQEAIVSEYPVTDQMQWEDEHFSEECHDYYRQGHPRIVPDVATDEWANCLAEFMQSVGVKSKVVAPIVQVQSDSSAKVWGLLIVHACSHYRQWQEAEANFLQRICNQLAIAIHQANLYQQLQAELAERKQAEAALRQSEELFRGAFDHAPIGISLVSPSGHFVQVNPYYCDLLGYSQAELLSRSFAQLTHPDDLDADLAGFEQIISGTLRSFHLQKRYLTKQGTLVPVLMTAALIRDSNGQPLYCVGHIQDLRHRLKVEQMKHEFISIVSHELRTPLTSIRGALGILGSGVFADRPQRAQQMLEIAISNSERLVRLVDDILSLERLESGKVALELEWCRTEELIEQAIESVAAIAEASGIELVWQAEAVRLRAAPDAIVQTLTNLLSNAIKFSAAGRRVWLRVGVEGAEAGAEAGRGREGRVVFAVADEGRGIPADKVEMIFEQFQQVDGTDARKKGGTGLGLAICKSIVQQHGGQIWVESEVGHGSTFFVSLPLPGMGETEE